MEPTTTHTPSRRMLILISFLIFITVAFTSGAVGYKLREAFTGKLTPKQQESPETKRELILEESTVIRAVKKVSPSVVSIAVSRRVVDPFALSDEILRKESGIGTGFVISKDGLVLTNRHVVQEDFRYIVITKDDKKFSVQKIFRDPVLDVAILKIDAANLAPAEFGDSAVLEVGQTVIAVGNALGRFKNTVTTGVVSGIRSEGVEAGDPFSGMTEQLGEVIQTDAAINPGNSGGPLLDSQGKVIGVNVAVSRDAQNIGFAIPINSVKPIIEEFMRTGKITRPYLGVRYEMISKTRALAYELPEGAYVREVLAQSPAERAGVRRGDIVVRLDGQAITVDNPLSKVIQSKKVGDTVGLVVNRDDNELSLTAQLGESPSQF